MVKKHIQEFSPMRRADYLNQIAVVKKNLRPDAAIHVCLSEFLKLIEMLFNFMSSKYFKGKITGPKIRAKTTKFGHNIKPVPHDDMVNPLLDEVE